VCEKRRLHSRTLSDCHCTPDFLCLNMYRIHCAILLSMFQFDVDLLNDAKRVLCVWLESICREAAYVIHWPVGRHCKAGQDRLRTQDLRCG